MTTTKAAHTAGPWMVLKGAAEGDEMRCAVVVERGKMQYLLATIENGAPGDFCETEEANARLIAAAPELLAMLVRAHDFIHRDFHHGAGTHPGTCDYCAAIAKATGAA